MKDRGERELIFTNKILIYFLQLNYSVILHLESHCSTIANFFAIIELYKFRWSGSYLDFNDKMGLHIPFSLSAADAIRWLLMVFEFG